MIRVPFRRRPSRFDRVNFLSSGSSIRLLCFAPSFAEWVPKLVSFAILTWEILMATATARTNPLSYLTDQLNELKAKGTHFRLRVLDDEQAAVCTFDGKKVINLASNNYLGLTTHPKLREAALEATRKYGVGSGAVRTIAGTMKIHMELEEKIARFKNVEACVVFQSGFAANAGTVSAVLGK